MIVLKEFFNPYSLAYIWYSPVNCIYPKMNLNIYVLIHPPLISGKDMQFIILYEVGEIAGSLPVVS